MPIPNYDNTLVGKYIRQIENPDSVGFDRKNRTWMNPQLDPKYGNGKYDKNNRGFGVDIKYNGDAKAVAAKHRGRRLTEQEERKLRNAKIKEGDSLVTKYQGSIPATRNITPEMRAMAIGAIYRGDGPKLWKQSNVLGEAYATGDTEAFNKAVYSYYRAKGLQERAENHDAFMEDALKKRRIVEILQEFNVIDQVDKRVKAAEEWADGWKERAGIKAEGGQLSQRVRRIPSWEELPIRERAAYIGAAVRNGIATLPEIRLKYKKFAEGGGLTDEEYIKIMERVAKENWRRWGDESEDAALLRILNDNTYDYRGYYNKYPDSKANAGTHWTDEFKTCWHPTFSNESIYSGKKSQYNPTGAVGGYWVGERYTPTDIDHEVPKPPIRSFVEGGALSTGSTDEIQETDEANRAYGTNVSLAHIPNTYGGGGSLYGEGGDTRQRQILERAESKVRDKDIYNNYRDAVDVTPAAKDNAPYMEWASSHRLMGYPIPAMGSNCVLNASQWVDPKMPIMQTRTITTYPQGVGYVQVSENQSVPGDLVIADNQKGKDQIDGKDNEDIAYHTMLLQGYNPIEGKEYVLNGTPYNVHKDAPLVTYSNGRNESNSLRRSVPLEAYIDQSEGKDNIRYYRYLDRSTVQGFIPTLTVTPKGNYYKGKPKISHYYRGRK